MVGVWIYDGSGIWEIKDSDLKPWKGKYGFGNLKANLEQRKPKTETRELCLKQRENRNDQKMEIRSISHEVFLPRQTLSDRRKSSIQINAVRYGERNQYLI